MALREKAQFYESECFVEKRNSFSSIGKAFVLHMVTVFNKAVRIWDEYGDGRAKA